MSTRFQFWLAWFGQIVLLLLIIDSHVSLHPREPIEHGQPSGQEQQAANPSHQSSDPSQEEQPPTTHSSSNTGDLFDKIFEPIFLATFAAACFTGITAFIYSEIRDHTKVVERAYVTLSHAPPGIEIDETPIVVGGEPHRNIHLSIKVQNTGNTPAIVTATYLELSAALPPSTPTYMTGAPEVMHVSLVKGSSFHVHRNFAVPNASIIDARRSINPRQIHLIGYVDYIDKFDERHRAGYGRVYNPEADNSDAYLNGRKVAGRKSVEERNNLSYMSAPGYNYDRKRKKGEGNDWDEPAQ